MSEDKRKNARTQGRFSDGDQYNSKQQDKHGRFSGGDSEYSSKRHDKQKSSNIPAVDKNKGEKRKAPVIGSRAAPSDIDLQYEEKSSYSFKELERARKPTELRFTEPLLVLSKTENGESRLLYDPEFMQLAEADEYMTILKNSVKWHDKSIVIRGVEYPQPRLVAWFGPHPYTYAGATLEARKMPDTILAIKKKAETFLRHHGIDVELNSVLLNLYRDEKDSVAWHSDDELSLGIRPTIASVSLGATRKFEMRPKVNIEDLDYDDIRYVNLTHGSLVVMDGCMQEDWLHRVPKNFHATGPRINLTFRTIHSEEELPHAMAPLSIKKSVKSPSTKVVPQPDPKFDEEHFPPLGTEISDKKTKLLPAKHNGKDYQKRKFLKEETWDDEMLQSVECSDETPKIQNNLNEKSSQDSVINSTELHPSLIDYNSNVKKESPELYEFKSDSLDAFQSCNYNPNEVYEHESKVPSPSEIKPVKFNAEPAEIYNKTADSGKKYMLNADAPDFVPQNKFERYSLSELAEYTSRLKNEEFQSFSETLFRSVNKSGESLFMPRDYYELEVYNDLNEAGPLSEKHLKIILKRISSMITNAIYKKNDPRYARYPNRSYDDNFRKPKQSSGRSQRH